MLLRQTPPAPVADAARSAGLLNAHSTEALPWLCVRSDLDSNGLYRDHWLLAGEHTVLVTDNDGREVTRLGRDDVQEFRSIPVVGSGLLQARVGGEWVDLLRFSNRCKYAFSRAARRLGQWLKKQTIEFDSEDHADPCRCKSCGMMLDFIGDTCPRCVNRSAAIRRMFPLLAPYWRLAGVMMLLLLLGIGLDMVGPRLTQFLVDRVLRIDPFGPHDTVLGQSEPYTLLVMVVAALACVQITRACIGLLNGRLGTRVATAITFDMRARLVDHLQKLSLSYHDRQQTGSLVGRVAYDTEAVQGFVAQLTGGFLMQLLLVACSAAMMFTLQPTLALYTLLPAPLVACGTVIFYRYVYPSHRRFWERSSRQAGMLNGILSGIRVVKAFAQEQRELDRFNQTSEQLRAARMRVDIANSTFYPLMSIVFQIGGWIVWYAGGGQVLGQTLTLGTLLAFFGYLGMFYGPLNQLTHFSGWVTQFSTQVHRIFEVLDTPATIPEPETPAHLERPTGRIEFREVVFGYSRQNPVVRGISLDIQPGQMIGIVGRSGSGKTTLINLLSRFYDVDEGAILLDGIDLRRLPKRDLRGAISVVLQEPFLFRGSVWQNLIYAREGASPEEAIAAARGASAHDFILRQPHAYDTQLGERGAGLSGGERQRLSLARALLCDSPILVLDEATSNVDSETEQQIQTALAQLVHGRTSIVIAHRLSTLKNCDVIHVMEEGKIVESGTHAQLMQLDGSYARMVRIQMSLSRDTSVDQIIQKQHEADAEPAVPVDVPRDPDSGLTPLASHPPRWLTPACANIHLGNRGTLHVTILNERIYPGVFALRCLPVQRPDHYISLLWHNAENRVQEIGLIRDLAEWPESARQLIGQSLDRRYLVHEIRELISIRPLPTHLIISAVTDRGEMTFTMRASSNFVSDFGVGGKMLTDVEENRFVIPDLAALPRAQRALFERHIIW